MNNLIIIGNGFDLAHGLKTSYIDFIRYMVDSHCVNRRSFADMFDFGFLVENYDYLLENKGSIDIYIRDGKNKFAISLLKDLFLRNWCDIESKYFALLTTTEIKPYSTSIKQLNSDFEALKNHLSHYLNDQQANALKIDSYKELFQRLDSPLTTILNFNYTNTIKNLYSQELKRSKIIHIHGELNNQDNPIVFGFAANDEESRNLIDKDDKEYMRNIKKHLYKMADNEDLLTKYLNSTKNIYISIFGHSCGISDKLILHQIFNHENIESISTFYYEEYEHYFETQVNIDRIMKNDEKFKNLILNYQKSHRMPQHGDDHIKTKEFLDYISSVRVTQVENYNKLNPSRQVRIINNN